MWLVVALGEDFFLENPHNSLIALHPRYIWMVETLLRLGIPAAWLLVWISFGDVCETS